MTTTTSSYTRKGHASTRTSARRVPLAGVLVEIVLARWRGGLSRTSFALLALAVMCALMAAGTGVAAAAQVPMTVTIDRFIQIENPDPFTDGDYYALVSVDGQPPIQSATTVENSDFTPHWYFSTTVDDTKASIPVTIEIFDEDILGAKPDDVIDLDPADGQQRLDLMFNPRTGAWGGEVQPNVGYSAGDGDHNEFGLTEGGEAGAVMFSLALSADGDTDDDGIPDGVERFGLHDANGKLIVDMAALGADPCRKTIALQIDFMEDTTPATAHSHRPTDDAVDTAKAAMNGGPVDAASSCPYPGFPRQAGGVNLLVDRVNTIDEQEVFKLDGLDDLRDSGKFDRARRPYFHYVLFAHDQAKDNGSSGVCCVDDRDFMVTLGHAGSKTGTSREQAGTILHELGHALGLDHGGASKDATNFKPNYLSVMNYEFQMTGIPDATGLPKTVDINGDKIADLSMRMDYSRRALATLDEEALDESVGIDLGTDLTNFRLPNYAKQTNIDSGAIDFNRDKITSTSLKQDLNRDYCVDRGKDAMWQTTAQGDDVLNGIWITSGPNFTCDTSKSGDDEEYHSPGTYVLTKLTGYDDWPNIQYRALEYAGGAGAPAVEHGPDMTYEQAHEIEQETYALFNPDLMLAKTVDQADARPGDALEYTVTAHNAGTGTAKAVVIVDTLPDATQAKRRLGLITPDASRVERFTYTVPCATPDGASVVNHATVSGTNLLTNPEIDTSNNAASATTTAHSPVITLSQTATSTVNAGEAITYRLTYANSGSSAASAVVVTETLPTGVYYSTALDLGSGPKPTSVVRNADSTTTLTWAIGTVAGSSGSTTIEFTARPSLLLVAGATVTAAASLSFTNANGCSYANVKGSSTTTLTAVAPSRNPLGQGYFTSRPDTWTSEILARIQATDQRFDASGDGSLSSAEASATFKASGVSPSELRAQLLTTLFNLAQRRINAATAISSKTATARKLSTVGAAVRFAQATLGTLPPTFNTAQYGDATRILDEINLNRSESY